MSTTTQRIGVWPFFRYRDAPAAIRFLTEAFGFEPIVVFESSEPGTVAHAELRWPAGGGIMLGSDHPGNAESGSPPGTGAVYLVTDEPDKLYERVRAAGARVVREIHDQDYGSREFAVRDPEGVYWSFGTYAGSSS
jgi:uncharacterized glyoxalase superfamily protein PhnB